MLYVVEWGERDRIIARRAPAEGTILYVTPVRRDAERAALAVRRSRLYSYERRRREARRNGLVGTHHERKARRVWGRRARGIVRRLREVRAV